MTCTFQFDRFQQVGALLAEMTESEERWDDAQFIAAMRELHAIVARARFHSARDPEDSVSGAHGWHQHSPASYAANVRKYPRAMAHSPRTWTNWSEDEEQSLIANARQGASIDELASRHQRRPNAIRRRLKALNYSQPTPDEDPLSWLPRTSDEIQPATR